MPYVSPRGVVALAKPPTMSRSTTSTSSSGSDSAHDLPRVCRRRKELGEVIEGRDSDPEIMEMMQSLSFWSGWNTPQQTPHEDGYNIDPLDTFGRNLDQSAPPTSARRATEDADSISKPVLDSTKSAQVCGNGDFRRGAIMSDSMQEGASISRQSS